MTTIQHSLALKRRMHAGELVCGATMDLVDPCVAEIMGGMGFDWILIDTEHGPIDISTLQTMLIGLKGSPSVPIIRVPWNDQVVIKRSLDVGAMGLVIPLVRTAQDVRDAISYAKYPPEGIRGCSPRRPSDYGRKWNDYVMNANAGIIVIAQIEHVDAVQNIDEILAVPDLDGIVIGPVDLSNSMGYFNKPSAPEVQRVVEEIVRKSAAAKVCVGVFGGGNLKDIAHRIDLGARFVPVGGDRSFIMGMGTQMLKSVQELGTGRTA